MKIIITESQLKHITEQSVIGAPNQGTDYGKNYGATGAIYSQADINKEIHDLLGWGSFILDFIPEVGPALGALTGAYDAYRYYKENDTKMATITGILTSLPFIGQAATNIPGVKELGKSGLNSLAKKLGDATAKFTKAEVNTIKGINLNKHIIAKETEGLFQRTLINATNKAGAKNVNKLAANVAHVADKGLNKGINQGVNYGVGKTAEKALTYKK